MTYRDEDSEIIIENLKWHRNCLVEGLAKKKMIPHDEDRIYYTKLLKNFNAVLEYFGEKN